MASRFTSKQSASQTLPAYMRHRANLPGPWLGGVTTACIGPFDIAGADANRRCGGVAQVGPRVNSVSPGSASPTANSGQAIFTGHGRMLALSWYARAVSGAGPTLVINLHTAPNSGAGKVDILNADIDLNATPEGVAYIDDTASAVYLVHDDSAAADTLYTSPDFSIGPTSGCWFRILVNGAAATASDVSVVLWYFPTSFVNVSPAND